MREVRLKKAHQPLDEQLLHRKDGGTRAGRGGYTVVDLFCGAGGASLGFAWAGFEVILGLDIDRYACATFRENVCQSVIEGDARDYTGDDLLSEAGGRVDVLIGCPPCQGFTRLRRKTDDPRNDLVLRFARIAVEMKPRVIVFENVAGMLHVEGGEYFKRYLHTLRRFGYHCVWDVLDAVNYGVPQFRKRVIVLASREHEVCRRLSLPKPTHFPPQSTPKPGLDRWRTVRDAIADLPPIEAGKGWPGDPLHVAMGHSERVLEIIRRVPKDGGSRTDLPRELWLRCHVNHNGHKDVYGRMKWDEPAPTLTSGVCNPSKGRYIHPEQDRGISLREAARLQTFPDDFKFRVPFTAIARQIGNALPPLFTMRIAEQVLLALTIADRNH